jgi:hypothetical protein
MTLSPLAPCARSRFAPALAFVALAAGCGGAPSADARNDEPTETTQSKLNTGFGVFGWETTDGTPLDIGDANVQTCFLTGVTGDLDSGSDSGPAPPMPNAVSSGRAFAGAYISGGHYRVAAWGGSYASGNANNAVGAAVACIGIGTPITSKMEATWVSGGPDAFIAPNAPNRYCFLESVEGSAGIWSDIYAGATVQAEFVNGGVGWFVTGTAHTNPWNQSHARASGVCVDLPPRTHYASFGLTGPSAPNQFVDSGNGMLCALTHIQGPWDGGPADGAILALNPGFAWTLNLSSGETVWGTCVN